MAGSLATRMASAAPQRFITYQRVSTARQGEFLMAHGGITVRHRPSLRTATWLERLDDGFPALFQKISTFNTATIRAVIVKTATDRQAAERLLDAMTDLPVQTFIQIAAAPWRVSAPP